MSVMVIRKTKLNLSSVHRSFAPDGTGGRDQLYDDAQRDRGVDLRRHPVTLRQVESQVYGEGLIDLEDPRHEFSEGPPDEDPRASGRPGLHGDCVRRHCGGGC